MAESRLIQGRYRLIETIGRGGMGEVWRARDESLGRQVAVKCLKPMGPRHEPNFLQVLRERFRREARVAAALQHRGITVVHDFGEDDGTLFLVMELLNGRNLSQLLDDNRRQPLPVADVIEIAEQLTAALAYTHEQEVVHRDLKPANIVRIADGTVKICDFGIARLGHDIGFTARLTGTGIAMGTPALHVARADRRRHRRPPQRPLLPGLRAVRDRHRRAAVRRRRRLGRCSSATATPLRSPRARGGPTCRRPTSRSSSTCSPRTRTTGRGTPTNWANASPTPAVATPAAATAGRTPR